MLSVAWHGGDGRSEVPEVAVQGCAGRLLASPRLSELKDLAWALAVLDKGWRCFESQALLDHPDSLFSLVGKSNFTLDFGRWQ